MRGRGGCVRRWSAWWLALSLWVGCDSDGASDSDAGAADGSIVRDGLDGSRTSDAAGMDARLADGAARADAASIYASLSPRAACQLYIERLCQRWNACNQVDITSCLKRVDTCPDVLFSTGSTRTALQVAECSERWATLSCGEVNVGAIDCTTPGTRATGESCLYASQCKSQVCSNAGAATCGVCQETLPEGAACTLGMQPCAIRLVCSGGICSKPPAAEATGKFSAGQPCTDARGCELGFVCRAVDAGVPDSRLCIALPAAGAPCDGGRCREGNYCSSGNVCKVRPAVGQPCATDLTSSALECAADAYCQGAMCVARVAGGGACTSSECGVGLSCLERQSSGMGSCLRMRSEGESCTAPYERCALATECKASRCEAVASQGLFQSTCGP